MFKLPTNPALFWEAIALAVISLLLLWLLRMLPRGKRLWYRVCAGSLAAVILLSGNILFLNGEAWRTTMCLTRL